MIPETAHFIWFGRRFDWVSYLSVRSAALRGGFRRIVLHHADDLAGERWWEASLRQPGVEARRLHPEALLAGLPTLGPRLGELYSRLEAPAAKANLLRAAILHQEGGVYLDLDTVTVASLSPLREEAGFFCGAERLVFPPAVARSLNPLVLGGALLRTSVRDLCRRLPRGWRYFRRLEQYYPTALNNAVLGARAGHPLLTALLEGMVDMPRDAQLVRYALGTHLLHDRVTEWVESKGSGADVRIHSPEVFYPLGPEVSEHWFRLYPWVDLDDVLGPATRVVHWYASVRTRTHVPRLGPDWVRRHVSTQLFSRLALPFLED